MLVINSPIILCDIYPPLYQFDFGIPSVKPICRSSGIKSTFINQDLLSKSLIFALLHKQGCQVMRSLIVWKCYMWDYTKLRCFTNSKMEFLFVKITEYYLVFFLYSCTVPHPVVVFTEDMRIPNNNEQGLGSCDGHVESLKWDDMKSDL